jgi:hypothetical protein
LQLCADGGYQLRLGVLGVPLIMVPDNGYMLVATPYGGTNLGSLEALPFSSFEPWPKRTRLLPILARFHVERAKLTQT